VDPGAMRITESLDPNSDLKVKGRGNMTSEK
jgi:hypothetical protein